LGQENQPISPKEFLKEILYRRGVFNGGKTLAQVINEIETRRYSFSKSSVSTALSDLSTGKDVILTRKGSPGNYVYFERIPPNDYFV
jgi:hypothetical protein